MQDTSSKTTSRKYYQSSSFKMAALFTILLGASAVLLGYYLYDFSKQNFIRETEAAIDNEIEHILSSIAGDTHTDRIDYIQNRIERQSTAHYRYTNIDNDLLAGDIERTPSDALKITEGVIGFFLNDQYYAAKVHTFLDGSQLLIARDITAISQTNKRLRIFSAVIMFFMLMVILVSFLISNFVVKRINIIAGTANDIIKTGDISRRISIDTDWDDLSNLAQTLNALLDKIEELINGVRDVSDNIAHDLRTPLTRLRNQLEEPLNNENQKKMIAEADHLLSTFSALLRISNIEKGKRHQPFKNIDLQNILNDVTELYEPLAEEKNIKITQTLKKLDVQGDKDLLFQVFSNILDNAIKFTPENTTIKIEINNQTISIADQGIGIPDKDKDKVLTRFYRTDKSRNTPGTGLGLSLAKAVLDLHKAELQLDDCKPGLLVSVTFL